MSIEENRAVVLRFFELSDQHDVAAAQELLDPGFIYHSPSLPAGDRETVMRMEEATQGAFPESRTIVEDVIAEGDRVVVRYTVVARHLGQIGGLAPTGREIRQTAIAIHRVAGGRIQEVWVQADRLGVGRQLGIPRDSG